MSYHIRWLHVSTLVVIFTVCVLAEIQSRHLPNTNHKHYRLSNFLDRWSRNRKIPACSNIIHGTYKLLFSTRSSPTSLTKALKKWQFAFLHQFEINNAYVSNTESLTHKRNYDHTNTICLIEAILICIGTIKIRLYLVKHSLFIH